MKTKIEIQYENKNILISNIEKLVKEDIKSKGIKMNTLEDLNIYYQPVSASIYYVAKTKTDEEIVSKAITIEM